MQGARPDICKKDQRLLNNIASCSWKPAVGSWTGKHASNILSKVKSNPRVTQNTFSCELFICSISFELSCLPVIDKCRRRDYGGGSFGMSHAHFISYHPPPPPAPFRGLIGQLWKVWPFSFWCPHSCRKRQQEARGCSPAGVHLMALLPSAKCNLLCLGGCMYLFSKEIST